MSDYSYADIDDVLDQRFNDIDDFEETMSPGEINAYLADQLSDREDMEVILDLDKVKYLFEFACGEEFEPREWELLTKASTFDTFWDALEVFILHYMRSEGMVY